MLSFAFDGLGGQQQQQQIISCNSMPQSWSDVPQNRKAISNFLGLIPLRHPTDYQSCLLSGTNGWYRCLLEASNQHQYS